MRAAKLLSTTEVKIADLKISNRLRPVSETAVESLKESIETLGLQYEIIVRKVKKSGDLVLVAGGHRTAAFQALGRETIPAKVYDCTDDWAALAEIDDNLAHAELDHLEKAVFLYERKKVYERAYPETVATAGADLAAKRWNASDKMSVASFVTATAEKMGVAERSIERLVEVGSKLGAGEIEQLRNAPQKVTLSDLQVIAKSGEASTRAEICAALGNGTAKKAKEVLDRRKAPGAAVQSPIEQQIAKLKDAFARAQKSARKEFVRLHSDDLIELIHEVTAEAESGPEVIQFNSRREASQ